MALIPRIPKTHEFYERKESALYEEKGGLNNGWAETGAYLERPKICKTVGLFIYIYSYRLRYGQLARGRKLGYKKRAAKVSLTRLETYINSINKDAFDLKELKIRVGKLEETYRGFTDVQVAIAAIDDSIEEANLIVESEDVEDKYIRIRVAAERLIKSRLDTNLIEHTVIESREVVANNKEKMQAPVRNSQVKLPRIELPTFNGKYEDWHAFFDMFNSLIHSKQEISNTQKFHYLRSSLKGDAAEIVSSLEISGTNYAWTRLKERYDNKRLIVNKITLELFSIYLR